MLSWIIAVVVCVLIWGMLWKSQLRLAFGILLGLPIAWIVSRLITPYFYITDMHDFPLWLPPLPLALIAIGLFVFGTLVWIRGNEALPQRRDDEHDEHDEHH